MGAFDGNGDGKRLGIFVGTDVGMCEGDKDGSAVGRFEGADVGAIDGNLDGANVGKLVGTDDGSAVGGLVGTDDGSAVGGRVYSTTIVEVDTDALVVAFVLAEILMPVIFELAEINVALRLPLLAAALISDVKEAVKFLTLPLYPSSVSSRRPSSF